MTIPKPLVYLVVGTGVIAVLAGPKLANDANGTVQSGAGYGVGFTVKNTDRLTQSFDAAMNGTAGGETPGAAPDGATPPTGNAAPTRQ